MTTIPHQQLRTMVLQYLSKHNHGQVAEVATGVREMALSKGMLHRDQWNNGTDGLLFAVQDVMWEFFREGMLFPGINESNKNWPFFHLSAHGRVAAQAGTAQPYDPDGFLAEFRRDNPAADTVIVEYLGEAVATFNHGCYRASAILLGCASEKAILVLVDAFRAALTDPAKKAKFEKDAGSSIYKNFIALQDRLERMAALKKFPGDLTESINGDLRGAFDLIRRERNEAGHPALATSIDADTIFLNLRVFAAYIRRVYRFVEFFRANPADW